MTFTKLAEGLDVSEVNAQLAGHPELWDSVDYRKHIGLGKPHSRMSDIWVRYNDIEPYRERGDLQGLNDPHIPVWYPAWDALPALKPIVFGLMATVQGEMLGGILITRIPSGEGIARHTDKSWHVSYYSKFYVSLQAGPGARFHAENEFIEPAPGDVYRFDNKLPHWVVNESDRDRVTLIVCIRTAVFKEGI